MDLGRILREVVSPVLHRGGDRSGGPVWEGVFHHSREVPASGPGFEGPEWDRQVRERLKGLRETLARQGGIPLAVSDHAALLSLLAASVREGAGKVRILDFGGGAGFGYLPLSSWLPDLQGVEYHVVETPAVCRLGSQAFSGDGRIRFHESLPSGLQGVDIVYACSALQYLEDFQAGLKALAGYRAPFMLLANLAAGKVPTYATAQKNVPGSVLPYWIVNIDELVEILSSQGYRLVFKALDAAQLPQAGLPEAYRLAHACNLLFRRV